MVDEKKMLEFEKYNWVHEGVKAWKDFEPLRPLEIMLMEELRQHGLQEGNLLEIGGGYGRAGLRFAQEGMKVIELETNLGAVRKFNRFAREKELNARAYKNDGSGYDFDRTEWDAIVCEYTFHCMSARQAQDLLANIKSATRQGGYNLVSVFTSEGATFDERALRKYFHPQPGFLRDTYENDGWTIVHYVEGAERTKLGPWQIASQIIARRDHV